MVHTRNPVHEMDHQEIETVLREDDISCLRPHNGKLEMSGSFCVPFRERVYCIIVTRDEIFGMSGGWDWVLKEIPRVASSGGIKV